MDIVNGIDMQEKLFRNRVKVLIYFSVNYRFFDEVVKYLKDSGENIDFSGILFGHSHKVCRKNYEELIYLSDIKKEAIKSKYNPNLKFLTSFENNYQIKISELIHFERHLKYLSKRQKLIFIELMIKKFLNFFENWQPDVILSEGLDDLVSGFLYYYATSRHITYIYPIYSRIGDRIHFSNRMDTGIINLERKFHNNRKSIWEVNNSERVAKIEQFIADYVKKKTQPSYVYERKIGLLFRYFSLNDLRIIIDNFKNYVQDKYSFDFDQSPFYIFKSRLERVINKKLYDYHIRKSFLKNNNLKKLNYFVYPLHFQPEAATLVQGRWLNDQLIIIKMISRVLPIDYILIVKEHKVSIGRRSIDFYKKILQNHNVFMIDENIDVYDLLINSKGVTTISSTMGIEAILLNKPVLTFGDIFYNILDEVVKVKDISKMGDYINKLINFGGYKKESIYSLIMSIIDDSFEMTRFSYKTYTKRHVQIFSDKLLNVIRNKFKIPQ